VADELWCGGWAKSLKHQAKPAKDRLDFGSKITPVFRGKQAFFTFILTDFGHWAKMEKPCLNHDDALKKPSCRALNY